jgi:hypothetical protein
VPTARKIKPVPAPGLRSTAATIRYRNYIINKRKKLEEYIAVLVAEVQDETKTAKDAHTIRRDLMLQTTVTGYKREPNRWNDYLHERSKA